MKKNKIQIHYSTFQSIDELDDELKELAQHAMSTADKAYAPYSKFHVGAALLLDDGSIVEGSNQENAAYPSGLCAERVALFYAGAQYPNQSIRAIAVVAKDTKNKLFDDVVPPCGSCRQVMAETQMRQSKQMKIILLSNKGHGVIFENIEQLMPFVFDGKNLTQ
jgi:cytidine deaminase